MPSYFLPSTPGSPELLTTKRGYWSVFLPRFAFFHLADSTPYSPFPLFSSRFHPTQSLHFHPFITFPHDTHACLIHHSHNQHTCNIITPMHTLPTFFHLPLYMPSHRNSTQMEKERKFAAFRSLAASPSSPFPHLSHDPAPTERRRSHSPPNSPSKH